MAPALFSRLAAALMITSGYALGVIALRSISSAIYLSGAMNLSFSPAAELILFGIASLLLSWGIRLRRSRTASVLAPFAVLALACASWNLFTAPPFDGAYFLNRYGRHSAWGSYGPSAPWSHAVAFSLAGITIYFAAADALRQQRPEGTIQRRWLQVSLIGLATALAIIFAYLSELLIATLTSGGLDRQTRILKLIFLDLAPFAILLGAKLGLPPRHALLTLIFCVLMFAVFTSTQLMY